MDWLQFISSMFGSLVSLAWPALILALILFFREDLRKLLPLLQFKYKGVEISVPEKLKEAEQEAAALPTPTVEQQPPESVPTPEEVDRFEELARASPRDAILAQARAVEDEVLRKVRTFPDDDAQRLRSLLGATRFLRNKGLIDRHVSALLDDLRTIRNTAVHTREGLTYDDAMRYRDLAKKVIEYFIMKEILE